MNSSPRTSKAPSVASKSASPAVSKATQSLVSKDTTGVSKVSEKGINAPATATPALVEKSSAGAETSDRAQFRVGFRNSALLGKQKTISEEQAE